MAKKEENPLFVGITSGNELRRSMLECSKGILESLKEHEKFKSIKEEKTKLIYQLKSDVKEISKLVNSLRTYLPKVKEVGIKKPKIKKPKEEKPKIVKLEKPKTKTEIEKLESELSEIEKKLNSLG